MARRGYLLLLATVFFLRLASFHQVALAAEDVDEKTSASSFESSYLSDEVFSADVSLVWRQYLGILEFDCDYPVNDQFNECGSKNSEQRRRNNTTEEEECLVAFDLAFCGIEVTCRGCSYDYAHVFEVDNKRDLSLMPNCSQYFGNYKYLSSDRCINNKSLVLSLGLIGSIILLCVLVSIAIYYYFCRSKPAKDDNNNNGASPPMASQPTAIQAAV